MTLTIDNAYNSKIISNNDASVDIVDIESRKLLFGGSTRDQLVTRKQSQVKPTSQLSLKISPPTLTYQGVRSRMDRVWTSMDWT